MNSPDRLGKSYERRGKLAAWTAAAGVLAVGGAKVEVVPQAEAAIEYTEALEAKSPRDMVADVNSRVLKMSQRIKSEPNVKKYPWKDLLNNQNMTTYLVTVKNAKNPSHIDGLMITVDKKNTPTELQYLYNFAKGQRIVTKGSKSKQYSINHRTFEGENPNVIELDVYTDKPNPLEVYRIGQKRETIPGSDYTIDSYVEYLDNPSLVSQKINYVFKQADNILRTNN